MEHTTTTQKSKQYVVGVCPPQTHHRCQGRRSLPAPQLQPPFLGVSVHLCCRIEGSGHGRAGWQQTPSEHSGAAPDSCKDHPWLPSILPSLEKPQLLASLPVNSMSTLVSWGPSLLWVARSLADRQGTMMGNGGMPGW